MSNLAVFNNFKSVSLLKSRFARRGAFEVWDANLHDSGIRPFKCPEKICDGSAGMNSIYPLRECECLGFESVVEPIQGFCPDQHFHVISGRLVQNTTNGFCAPSGGCLAGSPQPQPVSITGDCSKDDCDIVGFRYVITYVTTHAGVQVESSPSPPSNVLPANAENPAIVLSLPPLPNGFCITNTRIYRTEAKFNDAEGGISPDGSEYLLVATIPSMQFVFVDNVPPCDSAYPLTTHNPKVFPAPENIKFLARTEDGIAVADLNRVYISMAGQPMFSMEGVVNIENEIRCIQAIGNNILVLTDKFPVTISYSVSQGMTSISRKTIRRHLPLTSYKSVSTYGDNVFFASEYSLYTWSASKVRSRISPLLTPEQYKMLDPSSIVGTAYEFGYMLTTKELGHSIMLELEGDDIESRVVNSMMPISYINADTMSLDHDGHIIYTEGNSTYRWDYREQIFCKKELQDSDERSMCVDCCPYRFRFFYDNEGKNHFAVARIEFDERSGFSVMANFRNEHFGGTENSVDIEVVSSRGFAIPRFLSTQGKSVQVSGCATITEIRMATAYADLVSRETNNNQV